MKKITFIVWLLMSCLGWSQVLVINELDCDSPGAENMEFLELLSETPNFPLDGYVVVFFNGSASGNNSSYFTVDLDGYVTDINGLFLIGSNSVSPVPQFLIAENIIQNGPDAVAIYLADDLDFPEETVATIDNLIDVLIYETSDPVDQDFIDIFSQDPRFENIEQINEGPGNNPNSIQRFVDMDDNVFYTSTTPTPRQLNDGSGVVLNGISIAIADTQYNEDDSFEITFTSETPVAENLNFNILLDNFGFDTSDFTGDTAITIPMNENTASTTITLIDDSADEGDEVAKIRFESLPAEYLPLNNNLKIRIVDNDFTTANFGTPVDPTFTMVASTQPSGYYDSLDGLADTDLRQAIQNIIADPNVVRAQTYADVLDILVDADENPLNSNEVWLLYTEQGRPKLDVQTSSDNFEKWNREHTFPRSRGGFFDIEEDEIADGIDIFWTTKADSLRHGNSDAHALRAADATENSTRNNDHYGEYNGPAGNAGSFKGDVARSVLYMEIRYNGLEVVNGFPDITGQLGDLATLLDWHRNDPPDDFEMNRNNIVYNWQKNRNPFIDQPLMVEYIWGNNVGDTWNQPLSVDGNDVSKVSIYPNPTNGRVLVSGAKPSTEFKLYSVEGKLLKRFINVEGSIDLEVASGLYLLQIKTGEQTAVKKIIVD
ncbi:endonuclease [Winogradskyella forsetii]|uniref:endonuclease n=1 Tax=Winogradskyella forsetii TaxID=2686077 RepID=UPI0015C1B69D|nr:endonuclease [Winogradskyella forsetii]